MSHPQHPALQYSSSLESQTRNLKCLNPLEDYTTLSSSISVALAVDSTSAQDVPVIQPPALVPPKAHPSSAKLRKSNAPPPKNSVKPNNNSRLVPKRTRGWCFTLNNYVEADYLALLNATCKYVVIGKEVGESGTRHLQGYIYFEREKSLKQVKDLHQKAHWESAKGTANENYAYCTKEGNSEERGVRPSTQTEKGTKGAARIAELWNLARSGNFLQLPPGQIKTWEYIYAKFAPPPQDRTQLWNLWITGPSGAGKSSLVRKTFPTFYSKPMNKWWDGYQREDVVLLDDFDPEHAKYLTYYLKIWADHYAFNAEVKGGMLRMRPSVVIVTSQYSIDQCFDPNTNRESHDAVARRFKVVNIAHTDIFPPDLLSYLPDYKLCTFVDTLQSPVLAVASEEEDSDDDGESTSS